MAWDKKQEVYNGAQPPVGVHAQRLVAPTLVVFSSSLSSCSVETCVCWSYGRYRWQDIWLSAQRPVHAKKSVKVLMSRKAVIA